MINIRFYNLNIIEGWHLVFYLPKHRPPGSFSDRILQFKDCDRPIVKAWSIWATTEIKRLNIKFDYAIRALSSSELKTGQKLNALDGLGLTLQKNLPLTYCPEVLEKNRVTPSMHTIKTKPERIAAIKGSYFVANKSHDFNNKNILILDDVTTSQTTLSEILRALYEVWPNANCYFFALGKTEYEPHLNDGISDKYFQTLTS